MEHSSGVNHVIKRFTVTRATLFFVHLHCGSFLASSGTAASPPHVELHRSITRVTMAGSDPCFVQGFANNPQFP